VNLYRQKLKVDSVSPPKTYLVADHTNRGKDAGPYADYIVGFDYVSLDGITTLPEDSEYDPTELSPSIYEPAYTFAEFMVKAVDDDDSVIQRHVYQKYEPLMDIYDITRWRTAHKKEHPNTRDEGELRLARAFFSGQTNADTGRGGAGSRARPGNGSRERERTDRGRDHRSHSRGRSRSRDRDASRERDRGNQSRDDRSGGRGRGGKGAKGASRGARAGRGGGKRKRDVSSTSAQHP
jgi:hypothetical protein